MSEDKISQTDTPAKEGVQLKQLRNVCIVTKEMAANIAVEQAKNDNAAGLIVLSIDYDGSFKRTVTNGCFEKMVSTLGALRYTSAVFERDCMDMVGD